MTQKQNTVYFSTRDELSKVCLDDAMYVVSTHSTPIPHFHPPNENITGL